MEGEPGRRRRARPRPTEGASDVAPARVVGGRYTLLERIGAGASADVWRARDDRDGTEVAVKLLHAWLLPDVVSRTRFASEARAIERLRHPRIVAVRDVVLHDDEAAIVMDLVSGGTLADLLRRAGRVPPRRAAAIAADLASALDAAHRQGVIHRDVKPGNVLLDAEGRPRLADFGIARTLDDAAGLTVTGTVMGSLRYMAPEQLAGAPPSPDADVFALGAVLYEMLAGRPAFDATSPGALIEQQRHQPPPIRGVDAALASVALAAVRPERSSRVSSAALFEELLRGWLAGQPVVLPAPTRGSARPVAAVGPAGGRPLLAGPPARTRPSWRRRAGLLTAGAVLALAVAAIAWASNGLGVGRTGTQQGGVLGEVASPAPSVSASARSTPAASPRPTPRPVTVVRVAPAPRPVATHHAKHGHGGGHGNKDGEG